MKLCVKRIYCPACRRLVKGKEYKGNGSISVSCFRCGRPVWINNGVSWRYIQRGA
jgi:RNase P subunit RPR2